MAKDSKFKPGISGNPASQWKAGQSGNPTGRSKARVQFDAAVQKALLGRISPEEVSRMLVDASHRKEPWAVRELVRRMLPVATDSTTDSALPPAHIEPSQADSSTQSGAKVGAPTHAQPPLSRKDTPKQSKSVVGSASSLAGTAKPERGSISPGATGGVPVSHPPSSQRATPTPGAPQQGRWLIVDHDGQRRTIESWWNKQARERRRSH
jgi:hypothetical protein